MTSDELRDFLRQRRVSCNEQNVQHGVQFRCDSGEVFVAYDSGKVAVQGKLTELAEEVQAIASGAAARPAVSREPPAAQVAVPDERPVFVVYGHDLQARDGLELLLRRMGLEPIVLQNLPAGGDTIIEKLERYLGEHHQVGFACVLLTPDDEGHSAGRLEDKKYRARQNVVLELGMVLTRLGRRRVAILHKASVELPSDIAGLIYIPFKERVDEVKGQLYRELREAGYSPKADVL
jgi:predicted nucleotide-binding protein